MSLEAVSVDAVAMPEPIVFAAMSGHEKPYFEKPSPTSSISPATVVRPKARAARLGGRLPERAIDRLEAERHHVGEGDVRDLVRAPGE